MQHNTNDLFLSEHRFNLNLIYLKIIIVWKLKWLDQVPCKLGFGVKVAEYFEDSFTVINDCVQSRFSFSCSFIGLAAFSFKLTVSTNKLCWARTVVPNARGLTYFCTCSSILARIILAAAINACDFTITWHHTVALEKKKDLEREMRWEVLFIWTS